MVDSINKITVLILGSNGFIGRELVNLFKNDSNNYELTALNRNQLDLIDREAVDSFFENTKNNFDVIINSCSVGGSRLVSDDETIFYQNIITFENVARHCNKFKVLFYFGSGSYVNNNYYGNSKNIIEKLSLNYENVVILRIYNCFGKSELETRFISSCIKSCINGNDIIIHQDKYFDFFYVGDLFKVIVKIIFNIFNNNFFDKKTQQKNIYDMCYKKRYKLSDIAKLICSKFDIIKSKINNNTYELGESYCAKNREFNKYLEIDNEMDGLDWGIEESISKYNMKKLCKKKFLKISIIGTGQIGFDLLCKLTKLDYIEIIAFVGRNKKCSKRLPPNIFYSGKSIEYFILNPKCCDVVFDCTDSYSEKINLEIFLEQDIKVIDLTPSNIGDIYIPDICTPSSQNINMVTCGGQVSIPILKYLYEKCEEITYVEIITQISSESAGMATRINIDKYIETTEKSICELVHIKKCKVILNIKPSVETTMQTTLFLKTKNNNCNFDDIGEFLTKIKKYIPNYNITTLPTFKSKDILMVHIDIIGCGDYISKYFGNLDLINCVAIHAVKNIYENI